MVITIKSETKKKKKRKKKELTCKTEITEQIILNTARKKKGLFLCFTVVVKYSQA